MQIAANFYKAARPEPPRVLGLQLLPYSLGHHITLQAFDSSFLKGFPSYSDLILGAFVCSQTWQGWSDWKASWKLPAFLKLWGFFNRKADVKREGQILTDYIREGSQTPEIAIPAKGKTLSAPWECRIKLFLIEHLRLSAIEALDYPLALAWQEYCAHGEAKGEITLISEADEVAFNFRGSNEMNDLLEQAKAAHRAEVEEMKARASGQTPKEN